MAYNEELAERVRATLVDEKSLSERKMFGGLAFMVDGKMACGIVRDELMLRPGPEGADRALDEAHVREMDFTGRPMTGMVFVSRGALDEGGLRRWVGEALAYARTLPPK